jgi:hypothetical protein
MLLLIIKELIIKKPLNKVIKGLITTLSKIKEVMNS